MKKAINEVVKEQLKTDIDPIEDCHMGVRDEDGDFVQFPWVRFKTVMATEAGMTVLQSGLVHMVDKTKTGADRWPILKGERKQDRVWHVPCGVDGSRPAGAKKPKIDGEDDDDAGQAEDAHAFGEWWTEEVQEESDVDDSEDFYSTAESWQQTESVSTAQKPQTLWEEARTKDHHDMTKAFDETAPYLEWLGKAPELHPVEIGAAKEWVCSVCKRGTVVEETNCQVCGASRLYKNSKLDHAAKPRVNLPTGGIKKTTDPKVFYKKDPWHRNVYTIENKVCSRA
jgi:hypothetical protein